MTIAFYISGHGFGHASRQVEVINQIGPGHRILIRSPVAPSLLARTIRVPYSLAPGACDTGVVQSTSLQPDDEATVDAAQTFYATYSARVAAEARLLRDAGVRLVVGDIPPLAFSAADAAGVASIALANFTWDWIYETHPGFAERAGSVLETIRAAYRRAGRALELPFGAGFEVFPDSRRVPLIARRPTRSREATRAHFGLPAGGRVALLSFGGYGTPTLDLSQADVHPEWTLVTTGGSESATREGPPDGSTAAILVNDASLAGGFRYEDLVGAVDVVVTKPGYGIIAECISSGTAMLYTSRGSFREYELLVAAMPRVLRCRFISQTDLFAGRWRDALDGVMGLPQPPERMAVNGAEVAAGLIVDALNGRG